MEKLYIKVEKYLKKNFPGKKITKSTGLNTSDENIEIWGFNSIQINVLVHGNNLFYELALKTNK